MNWASGPFTCPNSKAPTLPSTQSHTSTVPSREPGQSLVIHARLRALRALRDSLHQIHVPCPGHDGPIQPVRSQSRDGSATFCSGTPKRGCGVSPALVAGTPRWAPVAKFKRVTTETRRFGEEKPASRTDHGLQSPTGSRKGSIDPSAGLRARPRFATRFATKVRWGMSLRGLLHGTCLGVVDLAKSLRTGRFYEWARVLLDCGPVSEQVAV